MGLCRMLEATVFPLGRMEYKLNWTERYVNGYRIRPPIAADGVRVRFRKASMNAYSPLRISVIAAGLAGLFGCDSMGKGPAVPGLDPDREIPAAEKQLGQAFIAGQQLTFGERSNLRYYFEIPYQTISAGPFYLDTTETTQAEFSRLTGYNPSAHPCPDCPVDSVSWFEAILFCNLKSKSMGLDTVYAYRARRDTVYLFRDSIPVKTFILDGLEIRRQADGFRLPTQREWFVAAHGGYDGSYIWKEGDVVMGALSTSWFLGNAGLQTHPVAGLRPNGYGIHDLSGNVYELTQDYDNKIDSLEADIVKDSAAVVFTGASYMSEFSALKIATRLVTNTYFRTKLLGFRTARNSADKARKQAYVNPKFSDLVFLPAPGSAPEFRPFYDYNQRRTTAISAGRKYVEAASKGTLAFLPDSGFRWIACASCTARTDFRVFCYPFPWCYCAGTDENEKRSDESIWYARSLSQGVG
jgi:formylglycine-generating enzyme